MSRQQNAPIERRLRKALRKICLAAGEGVGQAVAFSFALASNAFAAEAKAGRDLQPAAGRRARPK